MEPPTSSTDDRALDILRQTFGYSEFRLQQKAIIDTLIRGEDAVVLMPTGGGKSLCYQIPALVREGTGIVISPLIALMQDQVVALREQGVKAAFLNSSLDAASSHEVTQQLLQGELDLLYVAPERLNTDGFLQLLQQCRIALFAIDEAHCVSQWGHDFRPDYIQLSLLHERFPEVPRIALTATADEATRQEIRQRLQLEQAQLFIASFDRPNICYRITEAGGGARNALLRFIRHKHEGEAGIVYCLSRNKVEATARWLCEQGLTALPYHAGMSNQQREQHQQRFLKEDGVIIVATIAFGMGIDKPDVRFVAHLNLPKSLEAYYQETGRAGRDGLAADAWMAYGLQDVIMLKQMMAQSEADEQHKRIEHYKLETMLGFTEITGCRRQALLAYFGETLEQPCGNCDNCLQPPQTWDASEAAQKALSAVYRTGQRFGVNYLIDVLTGKQDERITRFGHDKLKVYGVGREYSAPQWRNIFRQLISRGLLNVDLQGHGSLRLADSCRAVLRGEEKLYLRQQSKLEKAERQQKSRSLRKSYNTENADNQALWQALRDCRKQLAMEAGIPAYMIFHDATLSEMLQLLPQNREDFALINGVGKAKLEKYADAFLQVIARHQAASDDGRADSADTVAETVALLRAGNSIERIAELRQLKSTTVYSHLASAIEQGEIELEQVVELSAEEINLIHDTLLTVYPQNQRLSDVHKALEGEYDYPVLRCVQAALMPA